MSENHADTQNLRYKNTTQTGWQANNSFGKRGLATLFQWYFRCYFLAFCLTPFTLLAISYISKASHKGNVNYIILYHV
jgi:hypothetical protein